MTMESVLASWGQVDGPDDDLLLRGEAEAIAALRSQHVRRARIIRARRLKIGAAAVVGAAVITTTPGSSRTPGISIAHPTPAPPIVSLKFTNAAALISYAAAHSSDPGVGDAPYWRVETRYRYSQCSGGGGPINPLKITGGRPPPTPEPFRCVTADGTRTAWIGITRPGAVAQTDFGPGVVVALPQERIFLGGENLTWPQVNARTWTASQLNTLVADPGPNEPGRATHAWYIFKNTGDVLAESPASPAIRKQMWDTLKQLPNVRLDGQVKDRLGRIGWQISYGEAGYGTESYIIDPVSGQILQGSAMLPGQKEPGVGTYVSAGPATTAPTPNQQ